jgi:outer membrane protein TolC
MRVKARVGASALVFILLAGCRGVPTAEERAAQADVCEVGARYRPLGWFPASPDLTVESSPADFVRRAVLRSPEVEQRFHEWRAAVVEITVARSFPDPILSLRAEAGEMLHELVPALSGVFPPHSRLRAAASAQSEASEARRAAFEQAVLDVAAETWVAYFEAALVEETLAVDREVAAILGEMEGLVSAQLRVAKVTQQDFLRVSSERDQIDNEIAGLEDIRSVLRARLRRLLGMRDSEADPPLPLRFPAPPPDLDEEHVLEVLVSRNRDVAMREAELREATALVGLARTTMDPEAMLSVGVNPVAPSFVMPEVGVSLPLWRDKIRAQIGAAKARRDAAVAALEATRLSRMADLAEALYAWRDAGRRLVLYGDRLLPKAQASLDVSRTSYSTNRSDITALLDAERGLRSYRIGAARARMDREAAWARIVYQLVSEGPGAEDVGPASRSVPP